MKMEGSKTLRPPCCVRLRYCIDCKRLLDRIYHQARTQDQLGWWYKSRSDEKSTREMLSHYRMLINENPKASKRTKFSVAEFIEKVVRQQRQTLTRRGRLMWSREAVEHFMSTPGGSLSLEAAEAGRA